MCRDTDALISTIRDLIIRKEAEILVLRDQLGTVRIELEEMEQGEKALERMIQEMHDAYISGGDATLMLRRLFDIVLGRII